ncbi:MAG: ATP-dependent DNA ligase [Balneolales bacterium]|nr:ATP-dependent DNA ligase [Balneolales bacterium]
MSTSSHFYEFARVAQELAETRRTTDKVRLCAAYLQTLTEDADLDRAVRFLGEGAFSTTSGRRAAIGHRTMAVCAATFLEIDYELVFRPSRIATGSASETIEKLMENLDVARTKRRVDVRLSLNDVEQRFETLAALRKREDKEAFLMEVWRDLSPMEIKYFLRVLGGGSLRIGFETRSILNAIAEAFNCDAETIRYTHMITGSLGKTAVMARNRTLEKARFTLFQPIAFMLASPVESRATEDISAYIAEEKFDGMRCQLHVSHENVMLFSRDLNDISASFPEITEIYTGKNLPPTVLDGEICVFRENTIQSFQQLQKRMGVKKPSQKLLKQHPVIFVAFDVVYAEPQVASAEDNAGRIHGDGTLFEMPLGLRRQILEALCTQYQIPLVDQETIQSQEDIDRLFERALSHGNEGLILKHKDSPYEFGQRKKSWLKVKKPGGSLDTVILYATAGSGKRGGTYSDFTLGIRVSDDERYEQDFVPIGKAYGGYTDDELKKLNAAIKPLVRERFGPTLSIEPHIVVEIEFDEIQLNKRTKAGYTLRFPRFRAIRWDKSPRETDSLAEVERLFNEKADKKRIPQAAFSIP